ncbi:MAG: Nif3-like dinuclear metal center hexameric protein [Oscillospiraceae bacterium]|nr:Nif3-like dinuclear metal center hexameric protein [Oscillospiraceae bacterium]
MTTVNDIFENLNELADVSLKMDFDNVGILVGSGAAGVEKCLIALDITDRVIDEAIAFGAQLIVSHHPVIFYAQKTLLEDDLTGRKLIKLARSGISAVCMHTNLDIARGGVNDALMTALNCCVSGSLDPDGCGRIGVYENAMALEDFLKLCRGALNTNGLRYVSSGKPVKKLAVMGGAGGSCLHFARDKGCDTYVTADVNYNSFLDAAEMGINLIDADHFCTENVIMPVLQRRLSEAFCDVEFKISEVHGQTVNFF